MSRASDYETQAEVYECGRHLPVETVAVWMDAAAEVVSRLGVERVLDLGAGTGRFSDALAQTFNARVIALEPSEAMQRQAAGGYDVRVKLVGGSAEDVPLASSCCSVAWLSNVVHHIEMQRAAPELRRVVAENGVVMIRGHPRPGHIYSLYRYFDGALAPSGIFTVVEEAVESLIAAGFRSSRRIPVRQVTALHLDELYTRARYRADNALRRISDAAFHDGLERLRAASLEDDGPVVDEMELVVVG